MSSGMTRWFVLIFLGLLGCGSPLVGLECRDGYARCGDACYDLRRDAQHCGGCGISCRQDQMCVDSMCVVSWDAAIGDAGSDAGSADAGKDASVFPPVPPHCTGEGSPADCTCDLGQLKCGLTCVDANEDPANCGECGNECAPGAFCTSGSCVAQCDPPFTTCGDVCADLTRDPYHCGGCVGRSCASGVCVEGDCLGATAGHVIALGHDMSSVTTATQRLFGNSVFLPSADPVRVLLFDQKASEAAKAGVIKALERSADATGRSYTLTRASPLTLGFLLSRADVLVIEAQVDAKDSSLIKNGESWSVALKSYLKRGRVVVLLEGRSKTNQGTYQILNSAGIFRATGRVDVDGGRLSLVAPGDAVATGVPNLYGSGVPVCGFETDEQAVVVRESESEAPVVIHVAR
jgi:hypothetical protein